MRSRKAQEIKQGLKRGRLKWEGIAAALILGLLLAFGRTSAQASYLVVVEELCAAELAAGEAAYPGAQGALLKRVLRTDSPSRFPDSCLHFAEQVGKAMICGFVSDSALVLPDQEYLGLSQAWGIQSDAPSITIGIADRWVDTVHPQLNGRWEFTDLNHGTDAHGTAVIGIAAAAMDELGVQGLAPGARLMQDWHYDPDRAVWDLAAAGAEIILAPWINRCYWSPVQQALYDEVREMGAIVVASAGNGYGGASCGTDGHAYAYPASLSGVLSVTGVGHRSAVTDSVGLADHHRWSAADSSSLTYTHNDSVDLTAPAYGVRSTLPGAGAGFVWGSSFAISYVAGAIALARQANPCLGNEDIEKLLIRTARPIDSLSVNAAYAGKLGAGVLQIGELVQAAAGLDTMQVDSGDTVVLEDQVVSGPITVLNGGMLSLHGDLSFATGASLSVLEGGMLEVKGAYLHASCLRWPGIRMQGGIGSAVLRVDSGAIIEQADTAVAAWGQVTIQSSEAIYRDCRKLLVMSDGTASVNARFSGSRFQASPVTPLRSFLIELHNTGTVLFEGCRFESSGRRLGGIRLNQSSIRVLGGDCTTGFSGFEPAIYATSLAGVAPGPLEVLNAVFEGPRSVRVRGLNLLTIQDCQFNMTESGDSVYAIHLEGAGDYAILDNLIQGGSFRSSGLVLAGCGAASGLVKGNSFSDCGNAVAVLGANGNRMLGARFRCNSFLSNLRDVLLQSLEEPASVLRWQGSCDFDFAANRFNSEGGWLADSMAASTVYTLRDEPGYWPAAATKLTPYFCDTQHIPPSCAEEAASLETLQFLELQVLQNSLLIDNGDSEMLLQLVENPDISRGLLEFTLSEANPYLSDPVLLALLDRIPDVVPDFLEFLLVANSPLSPNVLSAAEDLLPTRDYDSLLTFQSGFSPREKLEIQLANLRAEADLMRLKLWSAAGSVADVLEPLFGNRKDLQQSLLLLEERWGAAAYLAAAERTSDLLFWYGELRRLGRSLQLLKPGERSRLKRTATELSRDGALARNMLESVGERFAEVLPGSVYESRNVDMLHTVTGTATIGHLQVPGVAAIEFWDLTGRRVLGPLSYTRQDRIGTEAARKLLRRHSRHASGLFIVRYLDAHGKSLDTYLKGPL